jgi:hypothetical protein
MTGADPRSGELAGNLAAVWDRIAAACAAAGRRPEEITLIAVTKTFPARDVRRLAALGITDVGENRDQEARAKTAELADLAGLRWHFVGRLQRNKVNHVVGYADVVHAVDRPELVTALAAAAARTRQRPLDALVQVNLDTDPDEAARRGGAGRPGGGFGCAAADRADGGCAAGRRPGAGVRPAGRGGRPAARGPPAGAGAVGRHERRPGAGDRVRRDTCAGRYGVARR